MDAPKRWAIIPSVPTLTELGLGEATVAGWFGVATTPGTAPQIVEKLRDAFTSAANDAEVRRRIEESGLIVVTSTPDRMAELLTAQAATIGDLVQSLGLRKQ